MMKHALSITFIMLFGLFLGACSEENDAPLSNVPMSEAAQLSAAVSSNSGDRVVVKGESNLPDRTQLLISLENKAVNFQVENKAVVMKGAFSVTLSAPTDGLKAGNYSLKAVMPVAAGQAGNVQTVIGNQGQHLSGPLTKDISWGGRIVEVVSTYSAK
ncbi:MAG: hypothetical protein V7745_07525 [Pseudomonadales bacterium]